MPDFLKEGFISLSNVCNKIAESLTTIFTITFTVITIMQVFTRYVFKLSIPWPEEVAKYSLVWVAFLTASVLIREFGHVNIVYFVEKIKSKKIRHLIDAVVYFLISVFALFLLIYGIKQTRTAMNQRWASIPALSMAWVYLAGPVGGALMLIQSVRIFFAKLEALAKKEGEI